MANLLDQFKSATTNLPSLVNAVVPATPRRRAAVTAHDGYMAADLWVKARPAVFWCSVAGALASAGALYVRRKKGPETLMVYAASLVASSAMAWVSRPGQTSAVSAGGSATDQVMGWLDARAAKLDKTEPGWEAVAIRRMTG